MARYTAGVGRVVFLLLGVAMAVCAAEVPSIGCPSDGQVGPMEVPPANTIQLPIPEEAARQLAYYRWTGGIGILAPRGWHCFDRYGSSGDALMVSAKPLDLARGIDGPAVELNRSIGDTSGRFTVARIAARVFPSAATFVADVTREFGVPSSDYPTGPYPADSLVYKGKTVVEYRTPAESEGLGTQTLLKKNASPIEGVAILTGDSPPDLFLVAIRLPREMAALTRIIVDQVEREAK